jgi:hypothetical protein
LVVVAAGLAVPDRRGYNMKALAADEAVFNAAEHSR